MQFLSDVTVEGVADFLDEVSLYKRLTLSTPYHGGGSVQLFIPSGIDGFLGIGHGGSSTAYTGFWEGDIETCFTKLSDLADRGFLRIGTVDGEPKGVPRQMGEGTPIVYDAVSDSIYAYNQGNARWNQMAGGTKSVGYRPSYVPHWNFAGDLVPGTIEDTGHGVVFLGGRLEPAPHGISGTIGISTNKWDAVYAKGVYTDLVDAPSLGTGPDGKIIVGSAAPGGGGTGNVETDGGTKDRIPLWISAEKLGDSPLEVAASDLISHGTISPALPTSNLGSLTTSWGEVFAGEVRLKYTNVPFLGTNNLGQIRRASQTPITGTGQKDRLAKYSGNGTVLTNALIEDDGASLSFHGSALPKTGLSLSLGSQANPWLALHASSVTLGGLTNQSVLGTDPQGRIVKGTTPSLPADIVRSASGGIDTRLAMFSGTGTSRNIASAPVSFTGTELVVNDVPLRRNSTGSGTLGTSTTKWKGLFVDGIQLGPTMLNKPYLKTDPSGNIVPAAAPSGGGVTGGTANYVARWTGPTTLGIGKIFDDNSGTVRFQASILPTATGYSLGGSASASRWRVYCDVASADVLKSVNGQIMAGTPAASGTAGTLAMFDAGGKSVGNAPATASGNNVAVTGTVSADKVRISLAGQEYLGTNSSGEIVRGGSPEVQFKKITMLFPSPGTVRVETDAIPAGLNATVVGAAVALPPDSTTKFQIYQPSGTSPSGNKADAYTLAAFGWQAGDEVSILGKQNWDGMVTNWIDIVVIGRSVNIVATGASDDAGTIIGKKGGAFGLINSEMAGTSITITLAVYS